MLKTQRVLRRRDREWWRSLTVLTQITWLMVQFGLYTTLQSRCNGWFWRRAIAKLPLGAVVTLLVSSLLLTGLGRAIASLHVLSQWGTPQFLRHAFLHRSFLSDPALNPLDTPTTNSSTKSHYVTVSN